MRQYALVSRQRVLRSRGHSAPPAGMAIVTTTSSASLSATFPRHPNRAPGETAGPGLARLEPVALRAGMAQFARGRDARDRVVLRACLMARTRRWRLCVRGSSLRVAGRPYMREGKYGRLGAAVRCNAVVVLANGPVFLVLENPLYKGLSRPGPGSFPRLNFQEWCPTAARSDRGRSAKAVICHRG